MADAQPMTDAEVQAAFRDAERFVKLFDAFVAVRDRALQHIQMKQEIDVMEKRKTQLDEQIKLTQEQKAKAEASHSDGMARLMDAYAQKRIELETAHQERTQELDAVINQFQYKRDAAAQQAQDAESKAQQDIDAIKQRVAAAQQWAQQAITDLEGQIAAKQADLDRVQANFKAFLSQHNLAM